MSYKDRFHKEELYRCGCLRLERIHEPALNMDNLYLVIDNPDESHIKELIISKETDDCDPGTMSYEVGLIPFRDNELFPIYLRLEANNAQLRTWDTDVQIQGQLSALQILPLYGVMTSDPESFSPDDGIGKQNIEALHQSRIIGRDEVNDAMKEAIEQTMYAVQRGFFEQPPEVQRRMMNAIGGKLQRIYARLHSSGIEP